MVVKGPVAADRRPREAEDRRHLDERRQPPLPLGAELLRRRHLRPIDQLVDDRTAAIYELGLNNLQLSPGGGALPDKERRFEAGLLDLRKRQGLYAENPRGVEISEGVLYRARIDIPSQVPVGTYTAETFLIDDKSVLAAATREIEIGKSGFERYVALAARRHRFLYGLAAVLLSLGLGWAAAWAFRRRS